MICIMLLLFIVAGQYANYKTECSSQHAENTFLCMRLHPRGLTPSTTGMDDRYEDEKGHTHRGKYMEEIVKKVVNEDIKLTAPVKGAVFFLKMRD